MSNANIAIIQNCYAAFGRGDVAAIIKQCAPNVAWHCGGDEKYFPTFGMRNGPAGVESFFRQVTDTIDFAEFAPREFYADGDKVFVLGRYTGTVRKTKKSFASDWMHVFTFNNGNISQFREFLDTAAAAEAWQS